MTTGWAVYVFRHPDGREVRKADHDRRDPDTMGPVGFEFIEKIPLDPRAPQPWRRIGVHKRPSDAR